MLDQASSLWCHVLLTIAKWELWQLFDAANHFSMRATFQPKDDDGAQDMAAGCKFLPFGGQFWSHFHYYHILVTRTTLADRASDQGKGGGGSCKGKLLRRERPVLVLSSSEVGMVRTPWQSLLKRYRGSSFILVDQWRELADVFCAQKPVHHLGHLCLLCQPSIPKTSNWDSVRWY